MKISLREQGGWTAGIPERTQLVDLVSLSSESALEGLKLVEQLIEHPPVASSENRHARDDSEITICIENEGATHEFKMKTMAMTREFANLLNWLKKHFNR